MKRIGYAAFGLLFMAVAAYAVNIPLLTGPIDPSQILGTLNQLIQSINSNVQNKLYGNGVVSATGAGTSEQTLYTYTLPANTLANAGDSLRVECSAATAANANNKTLKLYFGASVISTPTAALNAQNVYLTYTVTRGASATAQAFVGNGMSGTGSITPVAVVNTAGTDDMSTALVIKCTGTDATDSAGDISGKMMFVELIK